MLFSSVYFPLFIYFQNFPLAISIPEVGPV